MRNPEFGEIRNPVPIIAAEIKEGQLRNKSFSEVKQYLESFDLTQVDPFHLSSRGLTETIDTETLDGPITLELTANKFTIWHNKVKELHLIRDRIGRQL